jgi:3',5'-cyclic AMP phosphodiesterase CpdA
MSLNADNANSIRLAHFSDIHVTCRPLGWQREDWFNKRFPAWLNLRVLGRAYRFRRAEEVLAALMAELQERRPDHVIFSGDATALGFEAEVAHAARLLGLDNGEAWPGIAVPGNHDYCTATAAMSGSFEKHFAPWLAGERLDEVTFPFARRVGPFWLVAANTSTANRWAWDASGGIDAYQLKRLEQLLRRLAPGPRILVTHYPVCLRSGKKERRTHGLRNLSDLVATAAGGGVCLWLHGHRHDAYYHATTEMAPFPVICAGSATQHKRWSYGEYVLEGKRLQGTWRVFDPVKGCFQERESFEVPLA